MELTKQKYSNLSERLGSTESHKYANQKVIDVKENYKQFVGYSSISSLSRARLVLYSPGEYHLLEYKLEKFDASY